MSEPITINGIVLSKQAINMITTFQDENSQCLIDQKQVLGDLLIEVIQQNVGDDRWTQFATALADQLDFLNCLQTH